MDFGDLLSRAWDILWNNKFLILLGVLVALGSGSGGGGNVNIPGGGGPSGGQQPFAEPEELDEFDFDEYGIPQEEMEDIFSALGAFFALGAAAVVALICVAIVVGVALWVAGLIARGGLIAGVDQIETEGASSFGQAWNAGWQKGWRLFGIGLIPAIPGIVLMLVVLAFGLAYYFEGHDLGETALAATGSGMFVVLGTTVCLAVIVSLVLELLRLMANRACILENTGVFESYRRGWEVLRENLGQGVILALIQVGIQFALGLLLFIPSIVLSCCCLMWPVLWAISGTISAYFSTAWTLAWREWTGKEIVIERAPGV
jgi:hypothetical protein